VGPLVAAEAAEVLRAAVDDAAGVVVGQRLLVGVLRLVLVVVVAVAEGELGLDG